MSTCYISYDDQWTDAKIAEATGWKIAERQDGNNVWTDDTNFVHVDPRPTPGRVEFCRYGLNAVEDFAEALDAVSEYEDEFYEILEAEDDES